MALSRRGLLLGAGSAVALAACAKAGSKAEPPPPAGDPATSAVAPLTTVAAGRGPARFVRSGPATARQVALTFHGDGDVAVVESLLAVARQTRAPITVFAVGQWLDANPSMAGRFRDDGHELANHTYTHPGLSRLERSAVASEIAGCREALARLTGSGGPWFRPSGVETPSQLMLDEAGAAGYPTVVGFDVDPLDYTDPGSAEVIRATTAGLHPGAIISLHTGHAGTVTAFAPIVAAIAAAGLKPVLVSDLLR